MIRSVLGYFQIVDGFTAIKFVSYNEQGAHHSCKDLIHPWQNSFVYKEIPKCPIVLKKFVGLFRRVIQPSPLKMLHKCYKSLMLENAILNP